MLEIDSVFSKLLTVIAVFILIQSLHQAQSVSAVHVTGVPEAPIPVDTPSPCVESAVQPVREGEVKEKPELPG